MSKKCGPLESNPVNDPDCSKAKMFHTAASLILMSLEVDVELDQVPIMTSSLLAFFL